MLDLFWVSRLPAIAHALALGYSQVVFLDSDAWFRPDAHSLDEIVAEHRVASSPAAASRAANGSGIRHDSNAVHESSAACGA